MSDLYACLQSESATCLQSHKLDVQILRPVFADPVTMITSTSLFMIISDSTEFTIASTLIKGGSNLRLPSPSTLNGYVNILIKVTWICNATLYISQG